MSDKPAGPDADPCPSPGGGAPSRAVVDLDAIRDNVAALAGHAGSAGVMAVVKADGYGHGLLPSARAAAPWRGDLARRGPARRGHGAAGGRPDRPRAVAGCTCPAATSPPRSPPTSTCRSRRSGRSRRSPAAARRLGRPARIHLKVDTGLGRNGAFGDDWPDLLAAARRLEAEGAVRVVGVWSHFVYADAPDHPTVRLQQERFTEAVALAERAGCDPEVRHLANSAATLTNPGARFDLVRPGLAVYGLSPVPDLGDPASFGLTPAMTFAADLAVTKAVPAGQGVSYGHQYVTDARHHAGPGAGRLRRRDPAQRHQRRPGRHRWRAPHRGRAGVHGPVRRRRRARAARCDPARRS